MPLTRPTNFAEAPVSNISSCRQTASAYQDTDLCGDRLTAFISGWQISTYGMYDFRNHHSNFCPSISDGKKNSVMNLRVEHAMILTSSPVAASA